MKDLGSLKYFLGIEVAKNQEGIFLCQRKYTLDIINEVRLLGSQSVSTPMAQQQKLALSKEPFMDNPDRYRRLVGRLIYLLATQPDLAYVVHALSQFMKEPRVDHWNSSLRVVRYLKGMLAQGTLLRANSNLKLFGWCDADYAGCPITRKSVGGWFVTLGDSPVSWKTRKQDVVYRSSAEFEYLSMVLATCELKWLKSLLEDIRSEYLVNIL